MAFTVNLGCKNVIRKVLNMENKRNYEKRRKNLEDNIIRLMMDKNLTARALSIRIEKNEWYITRMLNGKIDPSMNTLFNIAEALRVEPAELFTKKES
jgi:predicted transcriptional regulator